MNTVAAPTTGVTATAATAATAAAVSSVANAPMLAKGALRRLALSHQEPTPENFARAYADEAAAAGAPVPSPAPDTKAQTAAWAKLVERLAKNLERGGRQWTAARRKDSLHRVLDSSRSDAQRLMQRLGALMSAWETDQAPDTLAVELADAVLPPTSTPDPGDWPGVVGELERTVRVALPPHDTSAQVLADRLAVAGQVLAQQGANAEVVATVAALCEQARHWLGHRHRLVEQLSALCRELTAGLTDLTEDGSWTRGQCLAMQAYLDAGDGPDPVAASSAKPAASTSTSTSTSVPVPVPVPDLSVRSVRAASAVLAQTRQRQSQLRQDRSAARDAFKQLLQGMLQEVGELGEHTGRFQTSTAAHAQAIAKADTLEGLASVVKALLDDSRAVQSAVSQSQQRLQADRDRATEMETKVQALEAELRRLSDEVCTDALTQVANRRGLAQAFEAESARSQRQGDGRLAVGLIDIDNFKKLNDSLGHAAGDVALKTLAAEVRARLRPADHLARFGGEEFVVLLPDTDLPEAQQTLTRLQRSLSEALFLHEGREVFVTFSAGVTCWQLGETLDTALERADSALYVAKRSGKNRTCSG